MEVRLSTAEARGPSVFTSGFPLRLSVSLRVRFSGTRVLYLLE